MLHNSHSPLHRKQFEGEKENYHALHKQKTKIRKTASHFLHSIACFTYV